jgi:hypothetical protein
MNLTAAKIEKTLATPISGERIATSAERLRDWTGPVVPDTVEPCDNCGGNGDCECSDCGCEHPCANCDGSGEQSTHVIRYGRLLNQLVDLDRVSRLMEAVSGECTLGLAVTNRTDSVSMVRIEGTGWLALLMPLDESNLDGEKKEAASRAPVFTAAGET